MDADDESPSLSPSPPPVAPAPAPAPFVRVEEEVISNEKGRRLVHFSLIDEAGAAVLAVVGRERSIRHMAYAVPSRFLRMLAVVPPLAPAETSDGVTLKWKTRREVTEWLSSFLTDSTCYGSSRMMDRYLDDEDSELANIPMSKGTSLETTVPLSTDFSWLGTSWNCKKRRKHYRSFSRNGVTISVNDFVYVMAEDDKRPIAYVEDLYEDVRTNSNLVSVRWFHKVDEVGGILPPDVSDREIFFSPVLQDFSVECIDGLAAVLNPSDFENFQSTARQSSWEPFMCCRQIDNDDIKPFDIGQLQGYWRQEPLRNLYTTSLNGNEDSNVQGFEPNRKYLLENNNVSDIGRDTRKLGLGYGLQSVANVKRSPLSSHLLRKQLVKQKYQHQQLAVGRQVEVLSQDSGILGCWFRCTIIKRHNDKVKVRYLDIQNADETYNLEEWILASRVAKPDEFGIRLCGRPIVRPHISHKGAGVFNVGSVVDAWWNDGWWEGIVILKDFVGKLHVFLPGEKQLSVFSHGDLRHSQEWVGDKWNTLKDQSDIARSLTPALDCKSWNMDRVTPLVLSSIRQVGADHQSDCSPAEAKWKVTPKTRSKRTSNKDVPNLTKLISLNWSSVRKRKFCKETLSRSDSDSKRQCKGSNSTGSSQDEVEQSNDSGGFILPKSLSVEQELCNTGEHHLFSARCPSAQVC